LYCSNGFSPALKIQNGKKEGGWQWESKDLKLFFFFRLNIDNKIMAVVIIMLLLSSATDVAIIQRVYY